MSYIIYNLTYLSVILTALPLAITVFYELVYTTSGYVSFQHLK